MFMPVERFECAVLFENCVKAVRRGHTASVVESPVGCSGSAIQNPAPMEPAATLPVYVFAGFVIQKVAGRRSDASTCSPAVGVRASIPKLFWFVFPCSIPSSRNKPCPRWLKQMLPDTSAMFVPCTVTQRLNVFQLLLFR